MNAERRLEFMQHVKQARAALDGLERRLRDPELNELLGGAQFRGVGMVWEMLLEVGEYHIIIAQHKGGAFPRASLNFIQGQNSVTPPIEVPDPEC